MKRIIKRILVKCFNPIAKRLGFIDRLSVPVFQTNSMLGNFFILLRNAGFNPKHIVDIGANEGNWTKKAMQYFPNAYYTLVEPQSKLVDKMSTILKKNKKVFLHTMGLSNVSGTFKLALDPVRDDSASFRFSEEEVDELNLEQVEVTMDTLNNLLLNSRLPVPDIIKIDAEGIDIKVLEGASNFFGKTEVFFVEATISNKSMKNTLYAVIDFMNDKGYKPFDFTDLNRTQKQNALWLVEIVFVKDSGLLDNSITSYA